MDKEQMALALEADTDYRVLRRFKEHTRFSDEVVAPELVGIAAILDTETTGKDANIDRIIELGMIKFTFNKANGAPLEIVGKYNELEDPGFPIDPAATAVNGITDDMVKGKKIDDAAVEEFLKDVEIVIAHNAPFDRSFCEPRFPVFKFKAWACSQRQISWEAEKVGGQKLDYIAYRVANFFYEAHRAVVDCQALLEVLATKLPISGETGLKKILDVYQRKDLRIYATGSPFDKKSMLQARGYRWSPGENGMPKAWYIELSDTEMDNEVVWLKSNIYGAPFYLEIDTIDALSRFSKRRSETHKMKY